MSNSIIEVKKAPDERWGVFIDEVLIAQSKNHCDCDVFAEVLASMSTNAIVIHKRDVA